MANSEAAVEKEVDTKRFEAVQREVGTAVMSTQGNGVDAKAAALFQKAYQKMVALNRLDESLQSMLSQRRTLQTELKDLQSQINGTFTRMLDDASQTPQRLLQEIVDQSNP